jgi:hypothetical protein
MGGYSLFVLKKTIERVNQRPKPVNMKQKLFTKQGDKKDEQKKTGQI